MFSSVNCAISFCGCFPKSTSQLSQQQDSEKHRNGSMVALVSTIPPSDEPPAPTVLHVTAPPVAYKKNRRGSVSAEVLQAGTAAAPKIIVAKTDDARERLRQLLKTNMLFANLEEEQLEDVVNALFEVPVKTGDQIIKQGTEGDNFYVVESGTYVAMKDGEVKFTYEGKGSFGELALLYNTPRAATIQAITGDMIMVQAITDGVLWGLDRAHFKSIVIHSVIAKRQLYESILASMELFSVLTPENRAAIADCLQTEVFEEGAVVVRENEALTDESKFYIVEKGELECFKDYDGERRLVKTLHEGGWFGEVALLTRTPRQADVVAKTKTKLLSMSREAFERLLGPSEQLFTAAIDQYRVINNMNSMRVRSNHTHST